MINEYSSIGNKLFLIKLQIFGLNFSGFASFLLIFFFKIFSINFKSKDYYPLIEINIKDGLMTGANVNKLLKSTEKIKVLKINNGNCNLKYSIN